MPDDQLFLHRFAIKPRRHLDAWLELWPREVALLRRHGYSVHQAYLETDAEPKLSWLYSHPDPSAGAAAVAADPERAELDGLAAPHVFRNVAVRQVRAEVLRDDLTWSGTVVMRRYWITGGWPGFLDVWRDIVPVREKYGFECLFAVADEPHDTFTWAFTFDGEWPDFPAAQRGYYGDEARVRLRGVFDYMADYALHPAHQLPLA
ncbi:hypothetical protein [Tessaracoccus palaemonis]|uniref:NIPSNAP family protein n=1 Tax=Tessaracoccus palaemonis TaxID=2829499 RepID=A0ABX8SHN8_9ACTN|nr:hypothetical protein [Tessaracoccus palaemonis]QXT62783.1 hypothetical protein KDB89_13795 [Tessaracoccus palaemonis]